MGDTGKNPTKMTRVAALACRRHTMRPSASFGDDISGLSPRLTLLHFFATTKRLLLFSAVYRD